MTKRAKRPHHIRAVVAAGDDPVSVPPPVEPGKAVLPDDPALYMNRELSLLEFQRRARARGKRAIRITSCWSG